MSTHNTTPGRGVWKYPQEMFLIRLMTDVVEENMAGRRSTVWSPRIWATFAKKLVAQYWRSSFPKVPANEAPVQCIQGTEADEWSWLGRCGEKSHR